MPEVGWVLLLLVVGLIGFAIMAARRPDLFFAAREDNEDARDSVAPSSPSRLRSPDAQAFIKPRRLWEHVLNVLPDEAPHLFVYGPSGSGKTVFAQHLMSTRPTRIVVLDPKWQVGKWGGAPAYTVDDDGSYGPIDRSAAELLEEFRRRLQLHKIGQTAEPLTVIIDELPDLNDECPNVRKLFLSLLRMGRELQMRLIALSTGRGVEDLGLKGRGDARRNLVTVRLGTAAVELCPELARVPRPAVLEIRGQSVPIDITEVGPTIAPLPPGRHWKPEQQTPDADRLLLMLESDVDSTESPGKALESAENAQAEGISEVERAMIRGAVEAGKGKTESLQALKGYSGRRHREYSAAWEEAKSGVVGQARYVQSP